MICDACGRGDMYPTGIQLMSNPAQYPHYCNRCGASRNYQRTYPYIEYKEVGDEWTTMD